MSDAPKFTQRVLQIPADPRRIAESDGLSEALSEGRPPVANFIYVREDGSEVLVLVLGAPRVEMAVLGRDPRIPGLEREARFRLAAFIVTAIVVLVSQLLWLLLR